MHMPLSVIQGHAGIDLWQKNGSYNIHHLSLRPEKSVALTLYTGRVFVVSLKMTWSGHNRHPWFGLVGIVLHPLLIMNLDTAGGETVSTAIQWMKRRTGSRSAWCSWGEHKCVTIVLDTKTTIKLTSHGNNALHSLLLLQADTLSPLLADAPDVVSCQTVWRRKDSEIKSVQSGLGRDNNLPELIGVACVDS